MRAGDVKIGGLIAVSIDDIPHHGIRISHEYAESQIHKPIADNVVTVAVHHKRSLNYAVVAVDIDAEFEFEKDDLNPLRQRN